MVQASEIKDENALKGWLDARPEETRQRDAAIIAHRASMRVLPFFIQILEKSGAVAANLSALPILRQNLASGANMGNPAAGVKKVAAALSTPCADFGNSTAFAFASAHSAAAAAAAATLSAAPTAAARFADSAASACSYYSLLSPAAALTIVWASVQDDVFQLEADRNPERSPLWLDSPDFFRAAWANSREWLTTNPGHDFWIRWYEAALQGHPPTEDWNSHWDMLRDIALIPTADWDQGAEHIAELIAEMEERYRLLAETRRLKEELAPVIANATPAPIGHNHPPEPLEDAALPQKLTLIRETLYEAERELEKPAPDKSALRRIAGALLRASIEIAKYCGRKTDKAVDAAMVSLGTAAGVWLGTDFAAKLAGFDGALKALGEAIKAFAGG